MSVTSRKRLTVVVGVVCVGLLVLYGCRPPTNQEVVGTYVQTFGNVTDKLILMPDGIFRQELKCDDGRVWRLTNTWTLNNLAICLDQYFMVYDEEKKKVQIPPKFVGMCCFGWEGKGFSRWDGQLVWKKIRD